MRDQMMVKGGRLLLSLVLAGISAYLVYAFAVAPYDLVVSCTTMSKPDSSGLAFLAVLAGIGALIAAFSGDWG